MDGCEPPCGGWDLNSGPSEEQSVLLTAEPSLQPMFLFVKWYVKDGLVVKSTDSSSGDPEFNSQQPYGGSQPSVMGSDALFWCV